jgi:hypothetical protein
MNVRKKMKNEQSCANVKLVIDLESSRWRVIKNGKIMICWKGNVIL